MAETEMYEELVKTLRLRASLWEKMYDEDSVLKQSAESIEKLSRDLDSMNEAMLSLDVRPVRHGRWMPGDMPTYGGYKCSACGENTVHFKANYCPNCGARMDGAVPPKEEN